MGIQLANVTYNLTIVFLVFCELVNVLHNYSLHTENNLFGVQNLKHIFCIKTVIFQYICDIPWYTVPAGILYH